MAQQDPRFLNATKMPTGKRLWPLEEDGCLGQVLLEQNDHAAVSKRLRSSEPRCHTPDGGGCCDNIPQLFASHKNPSKNVPEVVSDALDASLNCQKMPFQPQIARPDADLLPPDISELGMF